MERLDYTPTDSDKVEGPDYTVVVQAHSDILELALSGQATRENASEIADVVTNIAIRYDCPVLVDVQALKGRLGVTDTYYHVRRDRPHRQLGRKTAVVDLPENASYYTFHEITATNAGFNIRYFNTLENARAWLRE